jgi:beta-phosphoglucomutase
MTQDIFDRTFGQTNGAIIPRLDPHVTEADIAAWAEEKEAAYRDILDEHFPAMDGASALVESLHAAGVAMSIGSSGPRQNVECVLRGLPGAQHFGHVVCGCDITHSKPHPEVFLRAAEKLNLAPAHCAVVEDSLPGLEAARRANMTAIALTGTLAKDDLVDAADHVVESLTELTPEKIHRLIVG